MEKNGKKIKKFDNRFFKFFQIFSNEGFTFVELILVIGVLSVILGMGTISLANFITDQALQTDREKVVQTLREARAHAVSDYYDSDWGVRFNTAADPDEFILFQGASYTLRDSSFDYVQVLQPSVDFQNFALAGGVQEVVFDQRAGTTAETGSFEIATDDQVFTIEVNALGMIDPVF